MPTAEFISQLEVTRTQSLVSRNMALAQTLHAAEYHLITPAGRTFSRDSYLAQIEAGTLQYVKWEIVDLNVRLCAGMAVVRYRACLEFPSGKVVHCWHTDSYEPRGECWQAVWSQATEIKPGAHSAV